MTNELRIELQNKMRWYVNHSDFQSFVDDLGWESWMEEFTEAGDGEVITGKEEQAINDFLMDIWRELVGE